MGARPSHRRVDLKGRTEPADGIHFSMDLLEVRVDRAFGQLFLGAIGKIRPPDARALARAIADHMRAVLGAPSTASAAHL